MQAILNILCQNLIDSGEKSAAELHEELDDAIVMHFAQQDIDPEAYPASSDGGEGGFHGWDESMSLAELSGPRGFMAVTANQITGDGDVRLPLPEVDIMDPNDPKIYAALEGCNSTCHSAEWGKMCNEKLNALGLEFKWKIRSTTSFVGIGSKTNTLGTRQMNE